MPPDALNRTLQGAETVVAGRGIHRPNAKPRLLAPDFSEFFRRIDADLQKLLLKTYAEHEDRILEQNIRENDLGAYVSAAFSDRRSPC